MSPPPFWTVRTRSKDTSCAGWPATLVFILPAWWSLPAGASSFWTLLLRTVARILSRSALERLWNLVRAASHFGSAHTARGATATARRAHRPARVTSFVWIVLFISIL